ncbi:MAG: MarR family winged helix-turn-helix transcriptional regulator [Verrucomicrobia bacterium]|nr:MarR family winged helix-turn-helix transcriptional regulator [Verrucomicrobiota bacterium]
MPSDTQSPATAPATGQWNPDQVFSVLRHRERRRYLSLMAANGRPYSAYDLDTNKYKRLHSTLKHLAMMCETGLLVSAPDPKDGRRTLYMLAPSVPVKKKAEGGGVIDFGFALLRSDGAEPPATVPASGRWKPDEIFSTLALPPRRRVLLALAHGKASTATGMEGASKLRLDATLKHLTALRKAGMLLTSPDPTDARQTLYMLAPSVPVKKTPEGGTVIDFGFVLLRL